jgi:acyl-CoA synthetase (AMP-forming)/AMP-acid ligase II
VIISGGWPRLSVSQLVDRAAAIATVLAELDVHRHEPVLVTLPEGPGFAESFAGAVHQDALPLVASPLLSAAEVTDVAAAAGARVVLASANQLDSWVELTTESAILLKGPHGPWVAALRLRSFPCG